MSAPRRLHSYPTHQATLAEVLAPRSVAVIGASERKHSVGRAIVENLRCFPGKVFAINPQHRSVLGIKTQPSIRAVPEPVDLAIIATPAPTVPAIIAECAAAGAKGAIVISAGFKETGTRGAKLEHEILARRGSMRVFGPNCLGVMLPHLGLNATFAATIARPGRVALLSQSGALCTALLDWSLREEVGFSAFVSLGSMADVGWGDLIDYLGDDPYTQSIVCYMESVGNARAFLSAAREVSFTKPIVIIKAGHTEAAARAAASHTGSLTGSDAVLDAAFRRVGVVRVQTIENLFDMAEALAKQPRPKGPHLAILTNAGGPGVLATDSLVAAGGKLAGLGNQTMDALNELLPAAWSHGNPVDILGEADAQLYGRAMEIVLKDDAVDGLLVALTPQAMTDASGTAAQVATLAKAFSKPILASWMGGVSLGSSRTILNESGIPTYEYPDAAAQTFAHMWQYSDRLRLLYERPALPSPASKLAEHRRIAEHLIDTVRTSGRTLLTEVESKQVLAAYGIPTVETRIARNEEEAVRYARTLGFPVVLKVFSETITHKADVGGVCLNLNSCPAVRRAWREIRRSVASKTDAASFLGVTVQPMISPEGTELILGSSVDPQFGPVVLFGAGGGLVEVLKDRALGFPPLTMTLARRLMEETRIFDALRGVRGQPPVDLNALAQLIVSFSHLVAEQRWIAEIDINPLRASPGRLIALDARIVLHPLDLPASQLPPLAIRPYPSEYESQYRLENGSHVLLRPIRPEDEDAITAFHATLSMESVQFRYFQSLPLKARVDHQRLTRICFADYDRNLALVAEHGKGENRKIIAVGRLNRLAGGHDAEFAVLVSDPWQGQGLGTHLLKTLIEVGRKERIERIRGSILQSNHVMLDLSRRLGFQLKHVPEADVVTAELPL